MHDERRITQRAKVGSLDFGGPKATGKEHVETERIFESVNDQIAWTKSSADIKLRDRLVWACIASLTVEMFLVFLHSSSVIVLPQAVLIAVSVHMGGGRFWARWLTILHRTRSF